MGNIAILLGLAIQATQAAAEYSAVAHKAAAEGRDASDQEVAAARAKAKAAIDALAAMG